MCGTDYCGTCSPTEAITDYAEGRSHTPPQFGDRAQRSVTLRKRKAYFESLVFAKDPRAGLFPEFSYIKRALKYNQGFAGSVRPMFNLFLKEIPEFAEHVTERPFISQFNHTYGRSARRKRNASRRIWRENCILTFIEDADNFRLMHVHVRRPIPWWRQPIAENHSESIADRLDVAHLLEERTTAKVLENA